MQKVRLEELTVIRDKMLTISGGDKEADHVVADGLLQAVIKTIAQDLHPDLYEKTQEILVLYAKVGKWYG